MEYDNGVKCKICGNIGYEMKLTCPCQNCGSPSGYKTWKPIVLEVSSIFV